MSDERGLTYLADRIAIQDCLIRYCRGIDRGDADLVQSAYWEDSYDDHGTYKGSGWDFGAYAVPRLNAGYASTHHTLLNSSVDVLGDIAHAETYVHAYHATHPAEDGSTSVMLFAGRYVDRFEQRGGEWRIANRTVVYDFSRIDPVDQDIDPNWKTRFTLGRRDRDDLSYGR